MPSAEHEQIVELLRAGAGLARPDVADQRAAMEASATMFPAEQDVAVKEIDARRVRCDLLTPAETADGRVVLYLHGGGYVLGSRNTHRGLAGRIAKAAKAQVLVPDYRLAPEHPFPAAVDDVVDCWHWLIEEGFAPERIAIAGDSAGGGLTMATLLALKDVGQPMPACAVGLSPWVDLEGTGPTAEEGAIDDPMIKAAGLRETGSTYAAGQTAEPLASPLNGNLVGLPPLLIQVGTREVLWSDSTRFAEKARAAGVDVTLEEEEGLIHVFQIFPNVPEAQAAVNRIGHFVIRHTD